MRSPGMVCLVALLTASTVMPGRADSPIWLLARSMGGQTVLQHPRMAPGGFGFWSAAPPAMQCRAAIAAAERAYATPPNLLAAIGRVESGRRNPTSGQVDPWPWSINAEGVDHVYDTKSEAVAAVGALQAQGVRSIDVGCMQVNLMYHPDAFASLEDAFDPVRNADYAARFLVRLRSQTGDWGLATAWYHSASPKLGAGYQQRVMASLAAEQRQPAVSQPAANQLWQGQPPRWPPSRNALLSAARSTLSSPGYSDGRGPFMLGNHADGARLILAAGGSAGRGLAGYRAAPVPIASGVALR